MTGNVLCGGLVVWGEGSEGAQEKRAERTLNFIGKAECERLPSNSGGEVLH